MYIRPMEHRDLNNLIALAVAQQLFLFQFRTSDHMGVEGRYHLMLRLMAPRFFYVCGSLPGQKNHQPFDPSDKTIPITLSTPASPSPS
ncbi:hypothetical protein HID58_088648 [Brassica napus]|uniref:Uncharacterized protein n=1 Tax=Brassica napus TaxID=3708 RepID=A0ABQ7XWR3_BRANA|nr:hypothetical protein HID58_088648 [Brassica napus]